MNREARAERPAKELEHTMKRRGPSFRGLEAFGVTLEELIELESRVVTFEIHIPVPPCVYPSTARLQRLLREPPKRRRAMVRSWRIEKYARLQAEVPFLIGRHEQIDFNGDPVGMVVTAPAATLARLSRLEHAGSVEIKGIRGRRARRPKPECVRLFSVKVRFVEQVEDSVRVCRKSRIESSSSPRGLGLLPSGW